MIEELKDNIFIAMDKDRAQSKKIAEKIFTAANPDAVYGKPIKEGERTIITASEIAVGGGFGFGGGFGPPDEEDIAKGENPEASAGSGAGGGGGSSGRPVAIVEITPAGVEVIPVPDVTKIAIAFLTTMGAILMTLFRIRGAMAERK